jgi:hypothetical protein
MAYTWLRSACTKSKLRYSSGNELHLLANNSTLHYRFAVDPVQVLPIA